MAQARSVPGERLLSAGGAHAGFHLGEVKTEQRDDTSHTDNIKNRSWIILNPIDKK